MDSEEIRSFGSTGFLLLQTCSLGREHSLPAPRSQRLTVLREKTERQATDARPSLCPSKLGQTSAMRPKLRPENLIQKVTYISLWLLSAELSTTLANKSTNNIQEGSTDADE